MEGIRDQVADLDVHRDTVAACCRGTDADGSIERARAGFSTTRTGLSELAAFLFVSDAR